MSNLDRARTQLDAIPAAINGSSASLQVLGNIDRDPRPHVMLAIASAHTHGALTAIVTELAELRAEVATLRAELDAARGVRR